MTQIVDIYLFIFLTLNKFFSLLFFLAANKRNERGD